MKHQPPGFAKHRNKIVAKHTSPIFSQRSEPLMLAHPVVRLQQLIGNQAVHRIIQAKLTVNPPHDQYETEADRVAAEVVRCIDTPSALAVQSRDLGKAENKEQLMTKSVGHIRVGESGVAVPPEVEARIEQARGGGQPLAVDVREPMERAFGVDFNGVRVHTDTQADQLNKSIQAHAFTIGHDVFFRAGQYNPEDLSGMGVIAHELTHVVQQSANLARRQFSDPEPQRTQGHCADHYLQNKKSGGKYLESEQHMFAASPARNPSPGYIGTSCIQTKPIDKAFVVTELDKTSEGRKALNMLYWSQVYEGEGLKFKKEDASGEAITLPWENPPIILVDSEGMSDEHAVSTLYHEAMHACDRQKTPDPEDESEEAFDVDRKNEIDVIRKEANFAIDKKGEYLKLAIQEKIVKEVNGKSEVDEDYLKEMFKKGGKYYENYKKVARVERFNVENYKFRKDLKILSEGTGEKWTS
jgi:hypothetical protein